MGLKNIGNQKSLSFEDFFDDDLTLEQNIKIFSRILESSNLKHLFRKEKITTKERFKNEYCIIITNPRLTITMENIERAKFLLAQRAERSLMKKRSILRKKRASLNK